MKTAISIPDKVFESAEKLSKSLGQSRSQLYTNAINIYITKHQKDNLTEKLNEIYKLEDSKLDTNLASFQYKSLPKDKW